MQSRLPTTWRTELASNDWYQKSTYLYANILPALPIRHIILRSPDYFEAWFEIHHFKFSGISQMHFGYLEGRA
jgi:hypothetical protein